MSTSSLANALVQASLVRARAEVTITQLQGHAGGVTDSEIRLLHGLLTSLTRETEEARRPTRVVLVGPPGIGKSTALCALTGLHMGAGAISSAVLPTSAGRTTLAELRIVKGDEYRIDIVAVERDELQRLVEEFSEELLVRAGLLQQIVHEAPDEDQGGLGQETRRAIRNQAGLAQQMQQGADGKFTNMHDPAMQLARDLPSTSPTQLALSILERMGMDARTTRSLTLPPTSVDTPLAWLKETYSKLNLGTHPQAPIPKTISITLPSLTGLDSVEEVVDSRGIDDTTSLRPDVRDYLDDAATVVLLCTGFADCPGAAAQAILRQYASIAPLQRAQQKTAILSLVRNREDENVMLDDGSSGNADVGRAVRREQASDLLEESGFKKLSIEFFAADRAEDVDRIRQLIQCIARAKEEKSISEIVKSSSLLEQIVDDLDLTKRATRAVGNVIDSWDGKFGSLSFAGDVVRLLANKIEATHPKRVHATITRRGEHPPFRYWQEFGTLARQIANGATSGAISDLEAELNHAADKLEGGVIKSTLERTRLRSGELQHEFLRAVQDAVELASEEVLKPDPENKYWTPCAKKYGSGQGYRMFVTDVTVRSWRPFSAKVLEILAAKWLQLREQLNAGDQVVPSRK